MPHFEGTTHEFVEANGLTFHVAHFGPEDGRPLLLLHGWPQHWWMRRRILPQLGAQGFRCIVPDLRGLGWSDAPPEGPYDKPQLARDVLALLDALGQAAPLPVIGHDWGAFTTLLLADFAPERIEKGLVLSVPAPWDAQPDPRRLLGIAHMPFLSAPFAEALVPQLTWQMLRISGFTREEAEPYLEVLRQPERRRATVGYYRTFVTRELPRLMTRPPAKPEVPVRLLGGDRDPVCRFSPSVEKVRGAGHFLPEDDPNAVLRAVTEFL